MPLGLSPLHLLVVLVIMAIWLVPLVLLLLVVSRARRPVQPDPRAVLAERLARGEITQAEFETAMRALGYTQSGR